ncbi:MAG: molybdopterin-guanine dinucleotide biosynthesis protein [Firmicutes bacterium]|nr:molybdopterin-guanine dinucleotide biosynthesis protein [Bacillota bacterium]
MKVFSVFGITKSGKTTTIEKIISELRKRRFSVGSVKEIHFEKFAIDTEGTNTDRHKKAGSQLVTARGIYETDILFQRQLTVKEILQFYDHDYVVLEGVTDTCAPKIITAHNTEEVDERLDDTVFAISGKLANSIKEYRGLPVINAITETDKLVDLVVEKVFERLPDVADECCSACGYTCTELCARILQGTAKREDCVITDGSISLTVDGREIDMVPFVQKLLFNAVTGVVKELDGYREHGEIVVKIKGR